MTDETELPLPGDDRDDDGSQMDGAPDTPRRGADDAPLVTAVLAGDQNQFGALYDRWFDRVFDLAYRIVRDTDAAADVAQETFLSAWRNLGHLEDPYAFGGWLLRIARNATLDRQRKDQRVRPADETQLMTLEGAARPEDTIATQEDPAQVVEDASYVALLWSSADALAERDREVLDLSLRHDMTPAEIGDIVGINRNAANQLVHRVKQRLATAVGARMLWRDGTPLCSALRAELVADDIEAFDGDAVRVTDKHANSCTECKERRRTKLSPEKMFAAIPIMALPSLRAKVAAALTAAGAPMGGSHALDAGIPPDPDPVPTPASGGSSGGGDGALPVPTPTGGNGDGHRRRVRRLLIIAGVLGLVFATILFINAVAKSREPDKRVAVAPSSTTTSTTRPSTTTTSSTSTTSTSTTTTTVPVPVTVPPTVPPPAPTTTTTTIPIRVTFTLTPNTAVTPYLMGASDKPPTLAWSVSGVTRVHVYDNVKVFDSTKANGSQVVCPKAGGGPTECDADAGTYTYTLDAFNSANILVLHRTVTLTITDS